MCLMENRILSPRSAAQTAILGTIFLLSACATPNEAVEAEFEPVTPAVAAAETPPPVSSIMILQASGGIETTYPPGRKLSGDTTICLKEGEKVTILTDDNTEVLNKPGCYPLDAEAKSEAAARLAALTRARESSRARTGAVRAESSAPPPPPVADLGEVVVIRGSKSALKRFKRKSRILTGTKICLKVNESLTVLRKKGGVLNLKGPGCNAFQRSGEVINVAGVTAGN